MYNTTCNKAAPRPNHPLTSTMKEGTGLTYRDVAESVIKGIAEGCTQAGAALVGGETAEMPGIYYGDDYDLAGFCVGVVEKESIIDGTKVQVGDAVIGLSS